MNREAKMHHTPYPMRMPYVPVRDNYASPFFPCNSSTLVLRHYVHLCPELFSLKYLFSVHDVPDLLQCYEPFAPRTLELDRNACCPRIRFRSSFSPPSSSPLSM